MTAAAVTLLTLGVAAQLVCCVGLIVVRSAYDRLHYAAAGSTLGPLLIGVAAAIHGFPQTSGTVEVVAAAILTLVLGPSATIAVARCMRARTHGDVGPELRQSESA